jgi:hypothetical protein
MKKYISFILIYVALTCNITFAQQDQVHILMPPKVVQLKIKPSKTDPTIRVFNSPHLVLYDPSIKQGNLLLFLTGTNGEAEKGPTDFFAASIQLGYRVISLCYIDTPAVSNTCIGRNLNEDDNCAEEFRIKRIYGENTSPLISDSPQDAIINRFTKLLLYLSDSDKKGNWGMYLENGAPKWDKIALVGQSQGGGMAAFIAKRVLVARVVSFSGGWDHSAKNKIAKWYFQKSITPPERWYGTYNIAEPAAKTIALTYKAMAIPDDHIYILNLEVRPGKKAHVEGINNIAYKRQWIELIGIGNLN